MSQTVAPAPFAFPQTSTSIVNFPVGNSEVTCISTVFVRSGNASILKAPHVQLHAYRTCPYSQHTRPQRPNSMMDHYRPTQRGRESGSQQPPSPQHQCQHDVHIKPEPRDSMSPPPPYESERAQSSTSPSPNTPRTASNPLPTISRLSIGSPLIRPTTSANHEPATSPPPAHQSPKSTPACQPRGRTYTRHRSSYQNYYFVKNELGQVVTYYHCPYDNCPSGINKPASLRPGFQGIALLEKHLRCPITGHGQNIESGGPWAIQQWFQEHFPDYFTERTRTTAGSGNDSNPSSPEGIADNNDS